MKRKKLLNDGELAGFFQRMALLTRGGLGCEDSLTVLREDAAGDDERELIDAMLPSAAKGEPLTAALDAAGRFPRYAVDMARVGETAGRTDETLAALAAHYRRSDALRRETVSALSYPAAMLFMMLLVMAVMSAKVLPVFESVLSALGGSVSPAAAAALAVSESVALYALILLGALCALTLAALAASAFKDGRALLSRIGARLFPRFTADTAAARFASALASLLSSGLDIASALDMASAVTEGAAAAHTARLKAALDGGADLDRALAESRLFSAADRRLITIGFRAGAPDEALAAVADRCGESAHRRLARLTGAVEPALVAALCLIVGAMLLSAILPLTGLFTAML